MPPDVAAMAAAAVILLLIVLCVTAHRRWEHRWARHDTFRGHSVGNGNEMNTNGLGQAGSGNGTGGSYDGAGAVDSPCGCSGSCASNCESCAPRRCPNSNNYWTDAVYNYNNFENFTTGPDPNDPYRPVIPVNKVYYPYACTSEPGGTPFIANWDKSFLPRPNGPWFQAAAQQAAALALVEPGPQGADATTWWMATRQLAG